MRISPRSCSYLFDAHDAMKIRWVTKALLVSTLLCSYRLAVRFSPESRSCMILMNVLLENTIYILVLCYSRNPKRSSGFLFFLYFWVFFLLLNTLDSVHITYTLVLILWELYELIELLSEKPCQPTDLSILHPLKSGRITRWNTFH